MASSIMIKSKIVSIVPRYVLSNMINNQLFVRRFDGEKIICVKPQEVIPFDPEDENAEIQVSDNGSDCSGPFLL